MNIKFLPESFSQQMVLTPFNGCYTERFQEVVRFYKKLSDSIKSEKL